MKSLFEDGGKEKGTFLITVVSIYDNHISYFHAGSTDEDEDQKSHITQDYYLCVCFLYQIRNG